MLMGDSSGDNELDRRKFLEEIRKRAEEEELRRIEEEEQRVAFGGPVSSLPESTDEELASEQKVNELRGRLNIALDRGKVERASEVVDELSKLLKDDSEVKQLRERIAMLQEEQDRGREAKRASEKSAAARIGQSQTRSESKQKRIVDLLENAGNAYQYEQYDRGLEYIQEVLKLDPENASAIDLRQRVEVAQRLSEQIKEEEARRKAEEAALFAGREPAGTPVTTPQGPDAWGSLEVEPKEEEVFGPAMEGAPSVPRKPPLSQRIMEVVLRIYIPPKVIITTIAVIVVSLLLYVVADYVRNLVPLPTYSVLILPAQASTAESDAEYTAAGLTADLISDLCSVRDLRVIAPTTSNFFRGSRDSPVQLARSVGANYVLKWSVSKSPQGVVVHVDLSDTISSRTILNSRYQNSLRELPALRLEIARALVEKMGLNPFAQGGELVKKPPTSVPAAYDAYLNGRSLLQRGDTSSLRSALAAFEGACTADSDFADAYAALAWTHLQTFDESVDTSSMHIQKASSAARYATALGCRSSEVYRVNGMIEQFRNAYEKALQQLELAVEVAPSDAESQRRLSVLYVARNRLDDALKAARRAAADDPRSPESFLTLGWVEQLRGEFDGALKSYKEAMLFSAAGSEHARRQYVDMLVYTQQPDRAIEILSDRVTRMRESYLDYYRLGRVYQIAGKPKQEWLRAFSRAKVLLTERLQSDPNDAVALTYLALVHARLGESKDAAAAVTRAQLIGGTAPDVLYNIARVYALRLDMPRAIEYLSRAIDRRYSLAMILDMDFYNLHSEPDFLRTITRQ
jgi:tetratricopeptide (TPR) repeat protein